MTKGTLKKPAKRPQRNSSFGDFLKKRAPIYLGLTGLFLIFVVPGLTQETLEDKLPEDLGERERRTVDALFSYDGANDRGTTILEELKGYIESDFGDQIYGHSETRVGLDVGPDDPDGFSEVRLEILTHKGDTEFVWRVNAETGQVRHSNDIAKYIQERVDYG